MATLKISLGKNNNTDNTNVPWYVEVIQNSVIILQCFSTQADPNSYTPFQCGITTNYDPTQPSTINYYNLGKLTNNISLTGINLVSQTVFGSGANITDGRKGSVSVGAFSGSFSGDITIPCNQSSLTASGVDFVANGTQVNGAYPSIASVNSSDSAWISAITPNVVNNPWYISVVSVTTPTPNLELIDANSFQVTNLNNGSLTPKTIELWKNGTAQPDLITTQGTSYTFQNVTEGVWKIRFKISGRDYSDFSNEIDLSSVSAIPTVSTWDATLSTGGVSNFSGTGVAGSTIYVYKNDNSNAQGSATVNSGGAWTYQANNDGNYKFTQKTGVKSISLPTANYTVNPIQVVLNKSATPSITTVSPISAGATVTGICGATGILGIWRGGSVSGNDANISITVTNGTWSWISGVGDFGSYVFTFTETGKSRSDATSPLFNVDRQPSTVPVITNLTPLNLPANLAGSGVVDNSTVKIYNGTNLVDSFTIDRTLLHPNGNWTWMIRDAGSYQVTVTEPNKAQSAKSTVTIVTNTPAPSGNTKSRFHYLTEESIDLFASGNINTVNSTGAGYRWLNNGSDVYLETVVSYVDQQNPLGLSGIMAFEQGTAGSIPASPKMIALLLKNDNSISILTRGTGGLQPVEVKNLPSKSFPIKLRIEKVGTDFVFSYSLNTGVLNDTLTEFYRTPIVLTDYCLALVGSSGTPLLQTVQFQQTICSWGIVGDTGSTG